MHNRARLLLGAALAVAVILAASSLPPTSRATGTLGAPATEVRGAYHVHTVRSDGSGTAESVAKAATGAGLQFVILTDHGDGTRAPDPPRYVDGVLLLDAVELSTWGGHYTALGIGPTPYPLAGAASAVVEDVRRLGGLGFVAHPVSPRGALAWTDWSVPFDGIEWLNADSDWRDESWPTLARMLLTYPVRPRETLASLLDRPAELFDRWDALNRTRPVPALAAADAHARIGGRDRGETDGRAWQLALPGYAASFRAFSNHVQLERPWTGRAPDDARALLAAIGQGRIYAVVDGLASPGGLSFVATGGARTARMGDTLPDATPVQLHAEVAAPAGAVLTLLRDGVAVRDSRGPALAFDATGRPGAYRVEVYMEGRPRMPWLVSNAIRVGLPDVPTARRDPPSDLGTVVVDLARADAEHGAGSDSLVAFDPAGSGALEWRYRLAPGLPSGQFAAIHVPVDGGLRGVTRIQLHARAERPVRVWIQLRVDGAAQARWGSTVYLDATPRLTEVTLSDLRPHGENVASRPPLDAAKTLLIVADTLNTLPGTSGGIVVSGIALGR